MWCSSRVLLVLCNTMRWSDDSHRELDRSKLHEGLGSNGRPVCRWCGGETRSPRRTWCSQGCVDAFLVRTDPNIRAILIGQRDQWECQICGLDLWHLERMLQSGKTTFHWVTRDVNGRHHVNEIRDKPAFVGLPRNREAHHEAAITVHRELVLWLRSRGWHNPESERLYQIDHTIPLIEGGSHGPENLRTLCVPCHKRETHRLAARRAVKRSECFT